VTAGNSIIDEPVLTVSRPPRFWGSPFGWAFVAAMCFVVLGGLLVALDEFRQPADPVVIVKGIMASKEDFFEDGTVKDLLRERGFEVEITSRGSREIAIEVIHQGVEQYDFAFPSGQPAADMIKNHRHQRGQYQRTTSLFSSPIVLATYREYADILVSEGIATAQSTVDPLYFTLDVAKFVQAGEQGKKWDDIAPDLRDNRPIKNGNRVLATVSGVCRSNSAATYLGLVAFVKNQERPPQNEDEVAVLAQQAGPLIAATGMPEDDVFDSYVTPEGKSEGPVVVIYEHQFLAYQIAHQERTEEPDNERVLLYPSQEFQTDPWFISLRPGPADQLAELLATDPELRERMMQLGYRVFDATETVGSNQLFDYVGAHNLPVPTRDNVTRAFLPELDLLESLIRKVGGCAT
jgi:hypothetical protein